MSPLEMFLFYVFIVSGVINTIHLGLYIGGANIYDMWQYRRRALAKVAPDQRQPTVSLIIPAHNERLSIIRCLDSIRNCDYIMLETIVHNDCSTDETADLIREYQEQYPDFRLRLVNRRKNVGKAAGVNYCIKKYSTGELIMTLDADCVLHKDAIKNAVRYFSDPKVVGVAANVRLMDKRSVLGILQQFEHMIGYRSKKFYTLANCEFIVGGVASTYRRSILEAVNYYDTDSQTEDIGLSMKIVALGNRENRLVYAADVVAATESVHSFKALLKQRYRWKMGSLQNLVKHVRLIGKPNRAYSPSLTFYRLPMAFLSEVILMLQPLVLGYILFLSIRYATIGFFLGAYLTITIYVLATIWPDEHLNRRRKLALSVYAPSLYFIFYVMDAIQVVSIIRCLIHPDQVRRKDHKSTWVSPERSGQSAQFS